MMSLPEFLLARLDEDAREARKRIQSGEGKGTPRVNPSPARVLADVEAKRRIVLSADDRLRAAEQDFPEWASEARVEAVVGAANIAEETLRLLALPLADHPDYRAEWAL